MSTGAVRYGCWAVALVCAVVVVVGYFTGPPVAVIVAAPLMVIFGVLTVLATQRHRRELHGRASPPRP